MNVAVTLALEGSFDSALMRNEMRKAMMIYDTQKPFITSFSLLLEERKALRASTSAKALPSVS